MCGMLRVESSFSYEIIGSMASFVRLNSTPVPRDPSFLASPPCDPVGWLGHLLSSSFVYASFTRNVCTVALERRQLTIFLSTHLMCSLTSSRESPTSIVDWMEHLPREKRSHFPRPTLHLKDSSDVVVGEGIPLGLQSACSFPLVKRASFQRDRGSFPFPPPPSSIRLARNGSSLDPPSHARASPQEKEERNEKEKTQGQTSGKEREEERNEKA